ncbi:MAG: lysophospholipid acyltransferase family protein [Candidatus Aminicenantes bacterium]|nr:lysophospholipid acyltransferase family protein [Candidatus Aminicenantes bacterium]
MKNYCLLGLYRLTTGLIRFLPRRLVLSKGKFLGLLGYLIFKSHRRLAWRNLELAFGGELEEKEKKRIARSAFVHFGQMIFDTIKFTQLREDKRTSLLHLIGKENLEKAKALGRGILLFSAHLGNWEIASWPVASLVPLHVVARPLDNLVLEKELVRLRQKLGVKVISKFQAARPILRALQANEAVAILIDQNVLRREAVFVDFFGHLAATTPVVAAFHLRTGAPIVPVFCLMTQERKYQIKIYEPLSFVFDSLSEPEPLLQITQVLTKIIEQEIRQTPDQWLWFHDRWRTRPENENLLRVED